MTQEMSEQLSTLRPHSDVLQSVNFKVVGYIEGHKKF
jgi:hypothetical protein